MARRGGQKQSRGGLYFVVFMSCFLLQRGSAFTFSIRRHTTLRDGVGGGMRTMLSTTTRPQLQQRGLFRGKSTRCFVSTSRRASGLSDGDETSDSTPLSGSPRAGGSAWPYDDEDAIPGGYDPAEMEDDYDLPDGSYLTDYDDVPAQSSFGARVKKRPRKPRAPFPRQEVFTSQEIDQDPDPSIDDEILVAQSSFGNSLDSQTPQPTQDEPQPISVWDYSPSPASTIDIPSPDPVALPNQPQQQKQEMTLEQMEQQLEDLKSEIYAQNNQKEFNINSPRQVSEVLFGEPGQSTNKEVLEAMGGAGNRMADLIIKYRQMSRKIKRYNKKEETKSSGTLVSDVGVVNSTSVKLDADPLLLVDTSAYIFRAYYSMPPLHRSDGMPIGAVMGFCNMLNRLLLDQMVDGDRPRLVLVFDPEGSSFRKDLYGEYKANRPECPMDLVPQFELVKEAAKAYGIPRVEAESYEADDVIATLATMASQQGIDTHILSGDKDLMQLITPNDQTPCIHMIDPMSMERVNYDTVVAKWNVGPELLGDVLALAGDSADNVPGVPGIGPKIAASLLNQFGSLENLLDKVDEVKQTKRRENLIAHKDKAILSRELVELVRTVPKELFRGVMVEENVGDFRMEAMDSQRLLAFYEEMGFRTIKRRVQDKLTQTKRKGGRQSSSRRKKATIPEPADYEDVPF